MHLKSGKVLLRKGGMVTSISTPLELSKSKEDFIKTNTIVGKLMKPVLQSNLSQQSPSVIIGGDIMDFSKVVKRNSRNLQKRKDDENIKFIY